MSKLGWIFSISAVGGVGAYLANLLVLSATLGYVAAMAVVLSALVHTSDQSHGK